MWSNICLFNYERGTNLNIHKRMTIQKELENTDLW